MTGSRENVQTADIDRPDSPSPEVPSRLKLAVISASRDAVRSDHRLRRYLSCFRTEEVLFLQGPPFFGAAFALHNLSFEIAAPMAILTIANVLLIAHVFLLNDWSGLTGDLEDPNRAPGVFAARGVGTREVAGISAGLLFASLALFSYLGSDILLLALAIALLSALYSLPGLNWKGRPILNSLAHFTGGILHFLLGYSLFSTIDGPGILIATFFALTFVAGHLTQEVRDREGDLRNGIRTNAAVFGSRRTFQAGMVVFTLAYSVLVGMALGSVLPPSLAALGLFYFLHFGWWLRTLRRGLSHANIVRLQRRYRALYAVIGLAMVAAVAVTFTSSGL